MLASDGGASLCCLQVRLCHDAQVSEQGDSREAVGAAMDQELPLRWSVEEDASQLFVMTPPVGTAKGLHGEMASPEEVMNIPPSWGGGIRRWS